MAVTYFECLDCHYEVKNAALMFRCPRCNSDNVFSDFDSDYSGGGDYDISDFEDLEIDTEDEPLD